MSYCFICHRQLGDSYDLMWAGAYTQKLVPVCSEDRECRAMAAGQRKKAVPKDGPNEKGIEVTGAIIAQKEGKNNV